MTIANYVQLNEANLYAGDNCDGAVFTAVVGEEDRFKHALWVPATPEQAAQYWAARKRAADFSSSESYCGNTGEPVYYCTCGWH